MRSTTTKLLGWRYKINNVGRNLSSNILGQRTGEEKGSLRQERVVEDSSSQTRDSPHSWNKPEKTKGGGKSASERQKVGGKTLNSDTWIGNNKEVCKKFQIAATVRNRRRGRRGDRMLE